MSSVFHGDEYILNLPYAALFREPFFGHNSVTSFPRRFASIFLTGLFLTAPSMTYVTFWRVQRASLAISAAVTSASIISFLIFLPISLAMLSRKLRDCEIFVNKIMHNYEILYG